ncbi:hypothetical protein Sango_1933500 [Sesamum angolense]|uniref:Reverse transcriptase domain-containing protein n=1 Tax=Sesamum angolense TaxID=2727404 RepID=A0AAE1WE30_9LAMI|nr:hypothetical protein Sango_1933500 [Sesamum angolense]
MVHHLDMRHSKGNLIIKLDMSKAYDKVNWQFLYSILRKMGFNHRLLQLIKNPIENCWFTVLVNGGPIGIFKSTQGLRQGDSLSPALFTIAVETLSRGLDHLFQNHTDMYYPTGSRLKISHLAYADDNIIFTRSNEEALLKLMQFLKKFEEQSGQSIKTDKSSFVPGKKKKTLLIAHRVKQLTRFALKSLPISYLGAPLYKGNKKKILFEPLIVKIINRISGWEHNFLSYGERLQLIKSVLSSMPIFLLQVLYPPVGIIHKVDQFFAKYFWGTTGDRKKIHWTKWQNICYPNVESRLGVRSLRDVVAAFSLKLWWRLREVTMGQLHSQ